MIKIGCVSIIIVNHNGRSFLERCIKSIKESNINGFSIEIIIVDNCSTDNSIPLIKQLFPDITIIEHNENNYTKAINLGIKVSIGDYIVLLNNDTRVDTGWLEPLLQMALDDRAVGAVQGKVLFEDGRINSAGIYEIGDLYFADIGFGEKDRGQYDEVKELEYFSGVAVLLKREAINDTGKFDEDFIMFCEDVDYSIRLREKGWKIMYTPSTRIYHHYHGVASDELCDYLCTRNRFLLCVKHFPHRLKDIITTSHFYHAKRYDLVFHTLKQALKKLVEKHTDQMIEDVFGGLKDGLFEIFGTHEAYRFFSELEVFLGLRRIRVGIYDHAFHFAGGGQRYVAKMAEMLQDRYDVTYISNKETDLKNYKDWFDIDLSKCKLKVLKIPFYEEMDRYFINEQLAIFAEENPFDIVSRESLNYDVFVNANMLTKVNPLSPISIFICHFPDTKRGMYFYANRYDYMVSNGSYTSEWIKRRWKISPTRMIHPPVDMYSTDACLEHKERIILSVARFEKTGSKKQLEMVRAFVNMVNKRSDIKDKWKFVMVGASFPENPYLKKVKEYVDGLSLTNIEIKVDLSFEEVKRFYERATIFWHACGLGEKDPHLIEHFGMTTVEAMQNYVVPVVIDGGGQKEIVEHGISGFRFKSLDELESYTLMLMENEVMRKEMALRAYERSHLFDLKVFKDKVEGLFAEIEEELMGFDVLDVDH